MGGMNDYDRIASVIEYLQEHYTRQPSLDELASRLGLSRYHFHRLFQRWASISPKTFIQVLTLQRARQSLTSGSSVLDSALESGLSGPGRLHDLCLKLEAATPGEIKSGGAGWTIRAGLADSPFGKMRIGEGPRGICHLSFLPDRPGREPLLAPVQADWPQARLVRDDRMAAGVARNIFSAGPVPALRALVRGSEFQVRVWRALLEIPHGQVMAYGQLARRIGNPGAARAVGQAVGRNPLAFLIPCHRVIRAGGGPGNYRWGGTRKQALLVWEQVPRASG